MKQISNFQDFKKVAEFATTIGTFTTSGMQVSKGMVITQSRPEPTPLDVGKEDTILKVMWRVSLKNGTFSMDTPIDAPELVGEFTAIKEK